MSRLEQGNVLTAIESVNMQEICSSVVAEMELFAHANNVTIQLSPAYTEVPPVRADRTTMRQVIQNVLSNAIKYTQNHQTVTMDLRIEGGEAVFSVADHGIGIPTVDQHRVFEPFFRAGNAIATRAEGSGLGLYCCKMLLERCNGRIWLNSEEGKGTTVFIAVPLATLTH
jgi:signal transduction histidine kinase